MKRRTATWLVTLILAAGCSQDLSFTMSVDLWQSSLWHASGGAVDSGVVCSSGIMEWVAWYDLEGNELSFDEFVQLLEKVKSIAEETGDPDLAEAAIRYQFEQECVCHDGSGAFLMWIDLTHGTWTITGGRGAYRALAGSGTDEGIFAGPDNEWGIPPEMPVRIERVGELWLEPDG